MNEHAKLALPPADLMYRVAGTSNPDWFVASGRQSVKDINNALGLIGRRLSDYKRILDFGCGCGRIMLALRDEISIATVTGIDIDREAVGWLGNQIPEAELVVVDGLPPSPLADQRFDLVYCHSVFTHLDELYQNAWLKELARVTAPGATLVISFSGETAWRPLEEQWKQAGADASSLHDQLRESGLLFITDDEWKNGPFPDFYHSTFHTLAYVQSHWGQLFRILGHIPAGSLGFQDFIVMERTQATTEFFVERLPERNTNSIPMPPLELRRLVGPLDDAFYENASGDFIFPQVPEQAYVSVFDFGCGCGRQARQLMQQRIPPLRYVGIDIHRAMVDWCQSNLSVVDSNFQFFHHNVFNLGLAPENDQRSTAPFPVESGEFTLVNAHSVFTHLYQAQAEYYLREIARILTPDGIARTTWFFFDKTGLPWLEEWQQCLFVNADDPSNAVLYDHRWFLNAVSAAGLVVREAIFPGVPGHQWQVFLEKQRDERPHSFPSPEECADWVCGAVPARSRQVSQALSEITRSNETLQAQVGRLEAKTRDLSAELSKLKASWVGKLTRGIRNLKKWL